MLPSFHAFRRTAVLAALTLSATACLSDPAAPEPEVEFMRVTVGAQEVLVGPTGTVTGGPISIVSGAATNVSVEFLDADMQEALGEEADVFQLNITTPAGVTFARTGAFAGTLTGGAAGTYDVSMSLFHIEEGHEDFGPFDVPVTVTAPVVMAGR